MTALTVTPTANRARNGRVNALYALSCSEERLRAHGYEKIAKKTLL